MGPLGLPTILDMVTLVERQDVTVGIVLLAAGLVFLMQGIRAAGLLVGVGLAAIGLILGVTLPVDDTLRWILGGVAGLGLALLTRVSMKVAVALLGGFWCAYAMTLVASGFGANDTIALGFGGATLLTVIAVTFNMYEQVLAFATSLQGALLFIGGLMVFASHSASFWQHTRTMMNDHPLFVFFLILAGTVSGFYVQLTDQRRKQTGASG